MSPGPGTHAPAAAAVVAFAGSVLDGTLAAARRLLRRTADEPGRTAVPPVGGVLANLVQVRREGERHLRRQRQRFDLFECLRDDRSPDGLAASLLGFAVREAGAQAGAFYLPRPGRRLVLSAHEGLAPDAPLPREMRLGQGLVGGAAAARQSRTVAGGDEGDLRLAGPSGPVPPGGMHVEPFHAGGLLKGVLVLAWRERGAACGPPVLAECAGSVAVALDSACARLRVQRLLEATRKQAVVLAHQQRELQATNAALARADRYKSEFLANMSHELRTPLNSMLIMSQVLAENRGGNLSPDEVDTAQVINRAGSDLLLIINDILDMTRVEAGKLELQPERVDPRRLVAGLEDLFRPVAARQGLDLRVEVAPGVPSGLTSDPLRLSQILKNLLNNAFKFTERGTVTLTVRAARPQEQPAGAAGGSWLAFAVTDTGIGMDAATAARVCEPFFQGDGSIGRRYGGSGLGLSISARLAALLGGSLDVTSSPGRGSIFVLLVPTAGTGPAAAEDRPSPAPAVAAQDPLRPWAGRLAGCRVLLVDDDMRTVYGLSHVLDRLQADVMIARSADEAAELAASCPDLDLLCVAPGPFAAHDGLLHRLVLEGPAGPRPCLWLGAVPAGWPGLRALSLRLTKPLDPVRAAEACARLCDRHLQPA